jgi:predicted ATPase
LPDDVRQMLDVASVLGREFPINALAAAMGEPRDAIIDGLVAPSRSN